MTDVSRARAGGLRVLAVHRYFWPDTPPYASLLRAIVTRWAADGHRVDVLSTQPSYKADTALARQPDEQRLDGARVFRVDLPREHERPVVRLANVARFAAAIVRHARANGPYDVIMASTAPPVAVGAAAALAARLTGARFLYHCMDIHPEIGRISGEFRNPVVFGLLRRLDSATCRSANRVIVLSEDMASALRQRPSRDGIRCEVINNFSLPDYETTAGREVLPSGFGKPAGRFRVLFAGNLGRFQGLESVVDAMHCLRDRTDIELVLLGEGRAASALRERAGDLLGASVKFFPHQPVNVAREIMRTADAGLVTLTPGIYRYAYPSKTMAYLSEGLPLIVAVEPDSALSGFVRREGAGTTVAPGDPEALAHVLRSWADDPDATVRMREQARRLATEVFDQDVVLDRWSRLLREAGEAA